MKIILSRKGFDSGAGGVPSPILPDGTLLSLPIPRPESTGRYAELSPGGHDLGRVVADLTGREGMASSPAHLDPDLCAGARPRRAGWRPLFGQAGAAQRHLERSGVGVGDLFLFFGWFRGAEKRGGRYGYRKDAPDLHVLFGWLEVGAILRPGESPEAVPGWAADHPHAAFDMGRHNTIYVASGGASSRGALGGGMFRNVHPDLVLTAPGSSRSQWMLPSWFAPTGSPTLTYHTDPARWSEVPGGTLLRTSPRGQEFVLSTTDYPQAEEWARELVRTHAAAVRAGVEL